MNKTMKIKDIDHKLDLHLKDYEEVRKDINSIASWGSWIFKIIIGAVILSILTLIGINKWKDHTQYSQI